MASKRKLPVEVWQIEKIAGHAPWLIKANERMLADPDYAKRVAESNRLSHSFNPPNGGVLGPLKHFRDRLDAGLFPGLTESFYIAGCFDSYLSGRVDTLDEAFNVGALPKVGTAVAEDKSRIDRMVRFGEMAALVSNNRVRQVEAAKSVKKKLRLSIDPESIQRSYSRQKSEIEKLFRIKIKARTD